MQHTHSYSIQLSRDAVIFARLTIPVPSHTGKQNSSNTKRVSSLGHAPNVVVLVTASTG